jgi:hypothetical protein
LACFRRASRSEEDKSCGGVFFPASDSSGLLLITDFVERKKKQETLVVFPVSSSVLNGDAQTK